MTCWYIGRAQSQRANSFNGINHRCRNRGTMPSPRFYNFSIEIRFLPYNLTLLSLSTPPSQTWVLFYAPGIMNVLLEYVDTIPYYTVYLCNWDQQQHAHPANLMWQSSGCRCLLIWSRTVNYVKILKLFCEGGGIYLCKMLLFS